MPVVAGPVRERIERDLGMDLAVARLGKDQPDGRPVPAKQYEIDPAGRRRPRRPGSGLPRVTMSGLSR